jgi:hypothetical protein
MGTLGFLEPLGVFHDSWRNVGLGQLAVSPTQAEAARQIPYVGSSPVSFLFLGLLRSAFSDTPGLLRVYPILSLLIYCTGLYALAAAFVSAHQGQLPVNHARFSQLSVFAFLAMAPLFWVRINPAPQSLAFALMPFCLAAVMNGATSVRFRMVALVAFGVIIAMHPITAVMIVSIGSVWALLDRLGQRRPASSPPFVAANTMMFYGCLFLTWLIYVGVWIIVTGGSFAERMLNILDSGQRATVTATVTEGLKAFIWIHRAALGGGALLVMVGLLMSLSANRAAGARLLAWFATTAAWLPFFLFGEFADRGPLFASLPAALAVGLVLSTDHPFKARVLVRMFMLLTAFTSYITAYSNHIGEVITETEITAFNTIIEHSVDRIIVYGYMPPLTNEDVMVYSGNRLRTHAVGAADFSYERLLSQRSIIVISDQMREAAALRGPQALAALERFEAQLLEDEHYQLIFDNGSVRVFRAP